MHNKIEDGFQPPTSTEYTLSYRRSFANGGYLKFTYVTRSWDNLYDYYPGTNEDGSYYTYSYTNDRDQTSARLLNVLKNTKDFDRTYDGVEIQWDFPLSKKVIFGGYYNFAKFRSNQGNYGSSSSLVSSDGVFNLQWVEHFDTMFGSREVWAPMIEQNAEFNLRYYFIVNLTQGKARSNFTLNGTYSGSTYYYNRVRTRVGYPVILGGSNGGPTINPYPAISPNPGQNQGGGTMANDSYDIVRSVGTNTDQFYNDLAYNLTMPLVRKLSWFLNVNVYGLFNHRYKAFNVPKGTGSAVYIPNPIQSGPTSYVAATPDPYPNGFIFGSNINENYSYYRGRAGTTRSISMSTGLRF
jgi:hypothetical protein